MRKSFVPCHAALLWEKFVRRFLISAAVAVAASGCDAPQTAPPLQPALQSVESDGTLCGSYSSLAASIMRNRQSGVSIATSLAALRGNEGIPDVVMGNAIRLVTGAYRRPAFSTKEFQQKEITEFANQAYLACLG